MNERRVVITGLGAATPFGIGIGPFWDALTEGKSAVAPIKAFDPSTLPSRIASEVPEFKAADFVPKGYRKNVKLMSRDIQLAVAAAYEAAKDAKLPTPCLADRGESTTGTLDPRRFGVNIGAGLICPDLAELAAAFATALDDKQTFDLKRWGAGGMENLGPLWLLKYLPNMLACHVTIVHDAQSFSNTITCGEASGHLAVGEAFRNIARGAMDVCICGGVESKLNPMSVARQSLMNRLVTDGDHEPSRACRPFAANRGGTVVSEGGGLLVLESLDHARARGVRIYAELVGFAAAGSIQNVAEPDADGAGLSLAIRNGLRDAGVGPDRVNLIGTFGCGTQAHDASEWQAWKRTMGHAVERVPALAIKGGLGCNGAGSGAMDLCAVVLSLYHNTVPASLNTQPGDGDCRLRFVQGDPVDAR
ncbi:MAG: beta-ketoacyl-[acyl-carrier-protein] synthase family protein, partial [Phycisphaerales bacterium]|nr:beta-ketoacyl-[acyl-carrier-protein] synthase family protein [Phycisphaerales bacterium]